MGVLDNLKTLTSIARKLKDPELMDQVMRLQESVLALQTDNGELRDKVRALEKEKEELVRKQEVKNSLVFEEVVYFLNKSSSKDGPYCPKCQDADDKLIRLKEYPAGHTQCPQCQNTFDFRYSPPQESSTSNKYNPFDR